MSVHVGGRGPGHLCRKRGASFSPAALFAASEPGAWYDPSDITTLFQDTAGTTPVTAAGQTVARINDKSGRGNHATQATAASRPIYQVDGTGRGHLLFDGVDDGMLTGTITPGIDKAQVFAGVRRLSSTTAMLLETSPSFFSTPGSLAIVANSNNYEFYGNATSPAGWGGATPVSPTTNVVSMALDAAGATRAEEVKPKIDGIIPSLFGGIVGPMGAGNFLAYPLYIGRRGGTTLPFNGRIYGLLVRFGANLSAAQISQMEAWMNTKTGAF